MNCRTAIPQCWAAKQKRRGPNLRNGATQTTPDKTGWVRGRLVGGGFLALFPGTAFAEVCDKIRPGWDGTQVTAFSEILTLAATPPALILLIASAVVIRFRHKWGALFVVVLWTVYASALTMFDPTGLRAPAMAEGCVGSPALFVAIVAAISVGLILYTSPRQR